MGKGLRSRAWAALRRDALARSGGRCQCFGDCGRHAGQCSVLLDGGPGSYHADHIIPRRPADPSIAPGPDIPANLRAMCPGCNEARSNATTAIPAGPLRDAFVVYLAIQDRLGHVPGAVTVPLLDLLQLNSRLPLDRRVGWWLAAPHAITLRLYPAKGSEVLSARAEAAIQAALDSTTAVAFRHGREWRVEIPRWPRPPVLLADMPPWALGLDTLNRLVYVALGASPGMMVVGQTGSGKSTALQVLIYHIARAGGELILIDPKYERGGAALRPFRRLAALRCAVAHSEEDARAALALALAEMDEREPGPGNRLLAVVIDEIHELPAELRLVVERIAKKGREVNVQVILATQHPTKDCITNALKNQLTWWLAGRVQNASASVLVLNRTGAQHLGGYGDMYLQNQGRDARLQVALGVPSDWARLAHMDHEPPPAPRVDRQDARYTKKPLDDRVEYLLEQATDHGRPPSARQLIRAFGGATGRNRTARDIAAGMLKQQGEAV